MSKQEKTEAELLAQLKKANFKPVDSKARKDATEALRRLRNAR